jgi:hypothetical protein
MAKTRLVLTPHRAPPKPCSPPSSGPPVSTFPRSPAYVRRNLGRPGAEPDKMERARQELAKGTGIGKTARLTGLGTGTVQRLKREMAIVQ